MLTHIIRGRPSRIPQQRLLQSKYPQNLPRPAPNTYPGTYLCELGGRFVDVHFEVFEFAEGVGGDDAADAAATRGANYYDDREGRGRGCCEL